MKALSHFSGFFVLLFCLCLASFSADAQVKDSPPFWIELKTTDGNTFVGMLLSEDEEGIVSFSTKHMP